MIGPDHCGAIFLFPSLCCQFPARHSGASVIARAPFSVVLNKPWTLPAAPFVSRSQLLSFTVSEERRPRQTKRSLGHARAMRPATAPHVENNQTEKGLEMSDEHTPGDWDFDSGFIVAPDPSGKHPRSEEERRVGKECRS